MRRCLPLCVKKRAVDVIRVIAEAASEGARGFAGLSSPQG